MQSRVGFNQTANPRRRADWPCHASWAAESFHGPSGKCSHSGARAMTSTSLLGLRHTAARLPCRACVSMSMYLLHSSTHASATTTTTIIISTCCLRQKQPPTRPTVDVQTRHGGPPQCIVQRLSCHTCNMHTSWLPLQPALLQTTDPKTRQPGCLGMKGWRASLTATFQTTLPHPRSTARAKFPECVRICRWTGRQGEARLCARGC